MPENKFQCPFASLEESQVVVSSCLLDDIMECILSFLDKESHLARIKGAEPYGFCYVLCANRIYI